MYCTVLYWLRKPAFCSRLKHDWCLINGTFLIEAVISVRTAWHDTIKTLYQWTGLFWALQGYGSRVCRLIWLLFPPDWISCHAGNAKLIWDLPRGSDSPMQFQSPKDDWSFQGTGPCIETWLWGVWWCWCCVWSEPSKVIVNTGLISLQSAIIMILTMERRKLKDFLF